MVIIIGSQEFEPMPSANAKNNSLFIDSSDVSLKIKDNDGNVSGVAQKDVQESIYSTVGCNTIRQLTDRAITFSAGGIEGWGDAYIDTNGRLNSVNTGTSTAVWDDNTLSYRLNPTYIIRATALTIADFAINNCTAALVSSGVWKVTCSTGNYEVRRAQIIKTFFYGTTGSDARLKNTYVTGITALETNIYQDIGKKAFYFYDSITDNYDGTLTEGTFDNTTTNPRASAWSRVYALSYSTQFQFPTGSTVNSVTDGTSDELGTDTFGDEADNPSGVKVTWSGASNNRLRQVHAVLLINSDITWSNSPSTEIDFKLTHSVPEMTYYQSTTTEATVIMTIPSGTFNSTISASFGTTLNAVYDSADIIQYKLTNGSDDSGWLDINERPYFTAFSSGEPTTITISLSPPSSTPTNYSVGIKGFWLRAS